MLEPLSPALLDLIVETPEERNSKLLVGLLAAVAGVVLLYLIVRRNRSKKP